MIRMTITVDMQNAFDAERVFRSLVADIKCMRKFHMPYVNDGHGAAMGTHRMKRGKKGAWKADVRMYPVSGN